jgi:hypothetical protein
VAYPDWLGGFGITTISITAQQFSGGVLTTPIGQSAIDFYTVVDRIYYRHEVELVNVTPTNSRQRNMVILETGATFSITELLRSQASALGGSHAFNSLAALFHAWDYFKLVFTRANKGYTFTAVNGGYDEEVLRERGMGVAQFAPAGIIETGQANARNPTYL